VPFIAPTIVLQRTDLCDFCNAGRRRVCFGCSGVHRIRPAPWWYEPIAVLACCGVDASLSAGAFLLPQICHRCRSPFQVTKVCDTARLVACTWCDSVYRSRAVYLLWTRCVCVGSMLAGSNSSFQQPEGTVPTYAAQILRDFCSDGVCSSRSDRWGGHQRSRSEGLANIDAC